MTAQECSEEVRKRIVSLAHDFGDIVVHSWIFDCQDGSFNVKAIIETKDGSVETIGWNIK